MSEVDLTGSEKIKKGHRSSKRELILQVAIRLFAKRGFAGVAMRQISKEAEITLPTIYHHFGNKEQLYRAVERELYSQHADALLDVLHSEKDARSKLRDFTRGLIGRLVTTPHYLEIMQRDLVDGRAEHHEFLVQMSVQGVLDELRGLLDQCTNGSGKGIQPILIFSTIFGFLAMRPVIEKLQAYPFSKLDEAKQLKELEEVVLRMVDTTS